MKNIRTYDLFAWNIPFSPLMCYFFQGSVNGRMEISLAVLAFGWMSAYKFGE